MGATFGPAVGVYAWGSNNSAEAILPEGFQLGSLPDRWAQSFTLEGIARMRALADARAAQGGPMTTLDWGNLIVGGANVVGAYFDRKNQRKVAAQEYRRYVRRQIRAAAPMPGAANPLLNVNPNLGGTAVNSMAALGFGELPMGGAADPFGGLASWQTAPVGGVDWSIDAGGGVGVPVTPAQVPAVVAAGAAAVARGIPALARILAKYVAPAAAVALAENLITDGVASGGPYRTEAANRALAYRGDLAACKRLRKLGSAIGYARGTGARRSVRRGRRC